MGPQQQGHQMPGCIKKSQFSTNISLRLGKDIRQGHNYYGIRIGNHTKAFEWYHFR